MVSGTTSTGSDAGSSAPGSTPGPSRPPVEARRPLYDVLTLAGGVVLAYLLLGLWYAWWRPDPSFLQFSSTVGGLLGVGSLVALTSERGRGLLKRLFPQERHPRRVCAVVWLLALCAALLVFAGSPVATRFFNRRGAARLEAGETSAAASDFRRAASLSPRDARTHYNLGNAYELLHDDEQAIEEYQRSLELDDTFWPVHNNLGRLFLDASDDAQAALRVLLEGQRRASDPLGEAVIGKNIARAYLESNLPHAALSTLEDVNVALQELQASGQAVEVYLTEALRIKALAWQALGQMGDAESAWQDCLGYALAVAESRSCNDGASRLPPECADAIRWAADAREHLAELTEEEPSS